VARVVVKTLEEAVAQLKRDPSQPVRTSVGDLTIEVRAVVEPPSRQSAADAFGDVGPWQGETTQEMLALLAAARERGRQRTLPDL
jgi:hypothetical protein